jgi:hypothetical protein
MISTPNTSIDAFRGTKDAILPSKDRNTHSNGSKSPETIKTKKGYVHICIECSNKFVTKANIVKKYCSKKCKIRAQTKRKMSKLCPLCRKVYIYSGSKRCLDCANGKRYSSISRAFSKANLNRSHRSKSVKVCPKCKIKRMSFYAKTCRHCKPTKRRGTAVPSK